MEKIIHGSIPNLKELIRSGDINPMFGNNDIEIEGVKFFISQITRHVPDCYPAEITLELDRSKLKDEEDFFRKICQVTYFLKDDEDVLEFSVSPRIDADRWYKDRIMQVECKIRLQI